MDDHERRNNVPAATHWNVERDPIRSFRCPRCGRRIRLGEVINPPEGFPDMLATCNVCAISFRPQDWQKAMTEKWRSER